MNLKILKRAIKEVTPDERGNFLINAKTLSTLIKELELYKKANKDLLNDIAYQKMTIKHLIISLEEVVERDKNIVDQVLQQSSKEDLC